MKRRLPASVTMASGEYAVTSAANPEHRDESTQPPPPAVNTTSNDKRRGNLQIYPLHEDPILQTLTPRSLAKNVAELDALRSRVYELETRLARHEVETLSPAYTPSKSRLPPLPHDAVTTNRGDTTSIDGIRSATDLKGPHPLISSASSPGLDHRVIATTPELVFSRKSIAPPLVLVPMSPSKVLLAPVGESMTAHVDLNLSSSAQIENPPSPASSILSTSSPQREQAKITFELDGDTSFAISQRQRLYQILQRVSTVVQLTEDDVRIASGSKWYILEETYGFSSFRDSSFCSRNSWMPRWVT
jgi:hypothetical protein